MKPGRRKAWVLALAMGAAAGLAIVGTPTRRLSDARPPVKLELIFPTRMGEWHQDARTASLVRPADEQGKLYGVYDQVLERVYIGPQGERIMLSVAYGTEQSVGLQVHRPEICYPSGGFKVSGIERFTLPLSDRGLLATRLLATQAQRSEPITYWTVLGDVVDNDTMAFRLRQLSFGVRGQILDGMLVRVSTLDANLERAWSQHASFIAALVQSIDPRYRARVIGVHPRP